MKGELKRLSLRRVLGAILVLAAAAAVLLGLSATDLMLLVRGPVSLDTLGEEELSGQYVTADVNYILDWYARTDKDSGATVEKEYIIPVGEAAYMGLVLPGPLVAEGDRLQEATAQYLYGGAEPGWYLQVRGTIRPLRGESLQYYYDMFGYDDLTFQQQELVLPLALYVGDVGDLAQNLVLLLAAGGGLCALAALYFLVKALSGGYQKSIRRFCDGDAVLAEQVAEFYADTQPVCGLRCGERFLMFQQGATTQLLDPAHIVWAYGQTVQHRTNGLPIGKTYGLVLRTDAGKTYTIPIKRDQVPCVLDVLAERYPRWVLGYADELAARYQQNPAGLRAGVPAAAGEAAACAAAAMPVQPDAAADAASLPAEEGAVAGAEADAVAENGMTDAVRTAGSAPENSGQPGVLQEEGAVDLPPENEKTVEKPAEAYDDENTGRDREEG